MKTSVIKIKKPFRNPSSRSSTNTAPFVSVILTFFLILMQCQGQGTMTFTFEGQPSGSHFQVGLYSESGMQFGMAFGPGSVYLSGGGIVGYPDNGTGYLEIPDGNLTRLRFGFNTFPPTTAVNFNLVSFDAARYAGLAPPTLEVVGYKFQIMGPTITVTNYFTVNSGGADFQTFYPDSSFMNVFQVDVFNARWSLDNLVIGGVPEPSSGALVVMGIFSAFGWSRMRRKRSSPR